MRNIIFIHIWPAPPNFAVRSECADHLPCDIFCTFVSMRDAGALAQHQVEVDVAYLTFEIVLILLITCSHSIQPIHFWEA